ncbi:MAG: hypothetical protein JXC31_05980 [Acholeplasmataceae bacterium]|nr:hypothetical protein [Acholeplasmataceae bacterium]
MCHLMTMSQMLSPKKIAKKNKLISLGFAISGFLSVLFMVISYFGQSSGNFVMSVDYDAYRRGIVLSNDEAFTTREPQLMTLPVNDARDITYSWIKINDITATDGNFIDPDYDYIAYTFYIKNEGNEAVDVIYSIKISDTQNNLDSSVRVLVIEDGIQTIFQKPDTADENGVYPTYPPTLPETKYFLSNGIITRKKISNFQPNEFRKYSVIVWLEGQDPDTTDAIIGGTMKLQMVFAIDDQTV